MTQPPSSEPPNELDVASAASSPSAPSPDPQLVSAIEALIYVAEEPATVEQMAAALGVPAAAVDAAARALAARYAGDHCGIEVRFVAGGYRLATKPQHHEAVRQFIRQIKPPLRLSLAALETLAVIAYRQPVTAPEVKDVRGVDSSGVLNTLLEKKLIATAGRKEVIGKPILYRTTREFLSRFGLSGLAELPTLKEFEDLTKAGFEGLVIETETPNDAAAVPAESATPELADPRIPPAPADAPE